MKMIKATHLINMKDDETVKSISFIGEWFEAFQMINLKFIP